MIQSTFRTMALTLYFCIDVLVVLLVVALLGDQLAATFYFWFYFVVLALLLVYGTQMVRFFPRQKDEILRLFLQKIIAIGVLLLSKQDLSLAITNYALAESTALLLGLSVPLIVYRFLYQEYLLEEEEMKDLKGPRRMLILCVRYLTRFELVPILVFGIPMFFCALYLGQMLLPESRNLFEILLVFLALLPLLWGRVRTMLHFFN